MVRAGEGACECEHAHGARSGRQQRLTARQCSGARCPDIIHDQEVFPLEDLAGPIRCTERARNVSPSLGGVQGGLGVGGASPLEEIRAALPPPARGDLPREVLRLIVATRAQTGPAERDGHHYSDKAPYQPIGSVPVYWAYRALGGDPFPEGVPGGQIGFESESGRGSTFWLQLPASRSSEDGGPEPSLAARDDAEPRHRV